MAFEIKKGDTAPSYETELVDGYGTAEEKPIDLTEATGVKFQMKVKGGGGPATIDASMEVVLPATGGRVRYDWKAGDTNTVGDYDVEYQITWKDGTVETVPNKGFDEVKVNADVS